MKTGKLGKVKIVGVEATYDAGVTTLPDNAIQLANFTGQPIGEWGDATSNNQDTFHGNEFTSEQQIDSYKNAFSFKSPMAKPHDLALWRSLAFGSNTTSILAALNAFTSRTSGVATAINDVAYGAGVFVAVGASGVILTSADSGVTWVCRTSGVATAINAVVWSGTQFVAVGAISPTNPAILTSPDGITWTVRTNAATAGLNAVTWSGTKFVAVGALDPTNPLTMTSTDGITWAVQTNAATGALNGVAWNGTVFIAVGAVVTGAAIIYTSTDGITWISRTSNCTTALTAVSVNAAKTLIIAVGASGKIQTSTDGTTWTSQASGTAAALNDVIWTGAVWRVVGASVSYLSADSGVTWVAETAPAVTMNAVFCDINTFVIVGASGSIYTTGFTTGAFRKKSVPIVDSSLAPSFVVDSTPDGTTLHKRYNGCKVSKYNEKGTAGKYIELDIGIEGSGTRADPTESDTTKKTESWMLISNCEVFTATASLLMPTAPVQGVQNITSGTATDEGVYFDSYDFSFDEALTRQDGFGGLGVAQVLESLVRKVSFKFTVKYHDAASLDLFANQTAMRLELNLKGAQIGSSGVYFGSVLVFPKLVLNKVPTPKGESNAFLTQDFEATVMVDDTNVYPFEAYSYSNVPGVF